MSLNPCPKCDSPRRTLEETCPKCGWTPARERGITNPIEAPPRRTISTEWYLSTFVVSGAHFLLVATTFWVLPSNLFAMPAGNNQFTLPELFAVYSFLLLNFPLGIAGFYVTFSFNLPLLGVWPWVLANSVVWGICLNLIAWSLFRVRRYKRSVLG